MRHQPIKKFLKNKDTMSEPVRGSPEWFSEWNTSKELAAKLNCHVTYVYALKKAGLQFRGQWSTMGDIQRFLEDHPDFTVRRAEDIKRRELTEFDAM